VATIFVKDNNDFRRISTNLLDNSGNRAVNTFLGSNDSAFKVVNEGQGYVGNTMIFGKEYLTAYQPIYRIIHSCLSQYERIV
jgi:hypothetical protein